MFDENIDVAAIMNEIKESVVKQDEDLQRNIDIDEIKRITDYIANVSKESERYLEVGNNLPACRRFPTFIAVCFRFAARVIRKAVSFILRDQIVVNRNMFMCVKALVEREDAVCAALENRVKELENKLLISESIHNRIFDEKQYFEFENRFRGQKEDIKQRMDYYINKYIKHAQEPECKAIDLGCGRGEWLQLVTTKGYKAVGVDINAKMVDECIESGLAAICDDAVEYLSNVESNSISVISAFQVIEHISKVKVKKLLEEAYRVLKDGGLLLIETPNICNIEVGASGFYLDPTHINPMHSKLLLFMAETIGFSKSEIVYWNQEKVEQWIGQLIAQDETNVVDSALVRTILETMKNNIYIAPDYALIAKK